jgi:flagellar P-ring protein precursor FlgI
LLYVRPDAPARVVINERTGTIVAGENVSISSTGIAHGNLYIGIAIVPVISQPPPLSGGSTVASRVPAVAGAEQPARLIPVPKSSTVAEVARSLNALGVTPRDLISIFQTMKKAGALHAELIIE